MKASAKHKCIQNRTKKKIQMYIQHINYLVIYSTLLSVIAYML